MSEEEGMLRSSIFPVGIVVACLSAHAQFSPLQLTPESYNQDVIVEKEAPRLRPATTATLDAGTNNTAFTFYEQGYNQSEPTTGITPAGQTLVSEALPDHSYAMPSDYTQNNALLIDVGVTNGTFTFTTPTALSAISFLATSGNGAGVMTYTVYHADNTTETGTNNVPDWYGGTNVAIRAMGRVNAFTRAFDNVNNPNNPNPRLYSVDFALSNTTSPVTRIDLQRVSGGHIGVFAVSGSTGSGFTPLAVTGFNQDMIVEASAEQLIQLTTVTTASMDRGVGNTAWTWYEQGYNAKFPATGLPVAGTLLTNAVATNHVYRLAPSYTQADAILVDSVNSFVTITPASPLTAGGLSFLGSSGGGDMTIGYTLHHQNGATQSGTFRMPDWFNGAAAAFVANGRVSLDNADLGNLNSGFPKLFAADFAVENNTSPITSIDLQWTGGTGHAAILAVAQSAAAVAPTVLLQPSSVNATVGGGGAMSAYFNATPPVTYRWQVGTNGVYTDITDGANFSGSTTTNLTLNNLSASSIADYIVIASNAGGSSTSRVARVNIVSSKSDVTTPFDNVTIVNGSAPAAEAVANAINDNTGKYLNFGTDGNQTAPFAGPVGLTVTLANGPAIVTGMRIYTANDATERDPIDYTLEGSVDGTNFHTIASGALSLPLDRNAANLTLDPMTLANQEVSFPNTGGYATYRITFKNVRNNTTANSMQIGEVELLGDYGVGAPTVTINRATDGTLTITSSAPGELQSTTSLTGTVTWADEGPIDGSRTVSATGAQKFYRVVQAQ